MLATPLAFIYPCLNNPFVWAFIFFVFVVIALLVSASLASLIEKMNK